MDKMTRRPFLGRIVAATACQAVLPARAAELDARHDVFVAEAQRMLEQAVAAGDQAYGAIVVRDGRVVGYGPSRVVVDRNPDAHAERVALGDAQRRLGTTDLSGAVMYSTSRPCPVCENAAAEANLARMLFGPSATDAGRPRRF